MIPIERLRENGKYAIDYGFDVSISETYADYRKRPINVRYKEKLPTQWDKHVTIELDGGIIDIREFASFIEYMETAKEIADRLLANIVEEVK
jgi:hypothetical protein